MATDGKPHRPTFLGIHSRDNSSIVLYASAGITQVLGVAPKDLVGNHSPEFIADSYDTSEYTGLFQHSEDEGAEEEASAHVMYLNLTRASGDAILARLTTFNCDNCVVIVGMAFPEVPFHDIKHLQAQVVQREGGWQLVKQSRRGARYGVRGEQRQTKAAFVLETPELEASGGARHAKGPRIAFVTGSVSRLIDADTSDIMGYPFLELVAPEDVLHVGRYFERLSNSTDVLFENFSLLQRPHVIDGDVVIADADNRRVVVECLGAEVKDGVALLLRKLRVVPAPKRDTMGNYIHSKVHEIDDGGYISLAEMVSSDPETSDAPGWSLLN
ncbi:hypothetical protein GGF46_001402 [Coemansia sp. RSA 552]|nr:hypothetical protein GGF46_001402 [Coemansia sp. RSA 552]